MHILAAAIHIVDNPERGYPSALRKKAWAFEQAAKRRMQTEENLALCKSLLGKVPKFVCDSLEQTTAEEMAAMSLFFSGL